ncbi:M50 family metallopeptidase [Luteimicrobium sp. DT211]|uniref:M50 family metallopeptidase n=1 Tax=Luteimicrobium sp. DT211 TaxID=3393412 RepID=UPI003CEB7E0E
MGAVTDVLSDIWHRATTVAPAPDARVAFTAAAVAALVVLVTPVWRVARNVVTIAHEGSHGLVAVLCGRRLAGIRLHSDTSGLTVSKGRTRGFGMVATGFAGYVGPGVLGLGAAWLTSRGYGVGMLWLVLVALTLLLLQIRNWYGLWSVLVTGALLFVVTWWLDVEWQVGIAWTLSWFLLLGAVRPVVELQADRSRGRARSSDADLLARLTGLPGICWVILFGLITVGCAVLGGRWLWP